MFQKICDKCGKVIKHQDKHMEVSSEAWQCGGTIWDENTWLSNVHLCENCAQELVKWLGRNK